MAPTVLPTGNDEDAHVNCKFLHLAFKIVSSAILFYFHLNDQKIRNCKFQTNNERFNTYFNLQEQQRRETQF